MTQFDVEYANGSKFAVTADDEETAARLAGERGPVMKISKHVEKKAKPAIAKKAAPKAKAKPKGK
jgi:hypothetical protein